MGDQDQNLFVVNDEPVKDSTFSSEPTLDFTTDSKAVLTEVHLGDSKVASKVEKDTKKVKFGNVAEEESIEQIRPFIPTLPQLFIFLTWTEFLVNFVRFIAICTVGSLSVAYTHSENEIITWRVRNGFIATGQGWFQITSWLIFLLTNVIFFTSMFFLKLNNFKAAATSTLIYFITYLSFFEAPLTTSYFTRAFQATFTFFRGIFIIIIALVYTQLHKQEIAPPKDHIPPQEPVALSIPTIPRLYVLLSLTQVAINFFRFIAICDSKTHYAFLAPSEDWFQVGSWILFLLMNMVSLTYKFYLHQQIAPAVTGTIFFAFTFLSLFEAPLTTSHSSREYQATFTFVRGIFILIISAMYALTYRQDMIPPWSSKDDSVTEGGNGGADQSQTS